MTDEEAARLRAQVQEATRVLSGAYTISQARQTALTEEYAETFVAAVERLLDERAAVMEIMRAVAEATITISLDGQPVAFDINAAWPQLKE